MPSALWFFIIYTTSNATGTGLQALHAASRASVKFWGCRVAPVYASGQRGGFIRAAIISRSSSARKNWPHILGDESTSAQTMLEDTFYLGQMNGDLFKLIVIRIANLLYLITLSLVDPEKASLYVELSDDEIKAIRLHAP
jgi:hypothetical protein